ncbi:hypothetical protein AB1285_27220 [Microbacterium sp. NRRL B-14842]|uniref:hypothetical protein n=1 Tax=Microbacterium sp. NRRL B-14842 TaxID=3162881 RepID=UPI003D271E86
MNLLGTIPWDPKGAAIYSVGAPTLGAQRTPYARAIGALLLSYSDVLNTRTYTTTDWRDSSERPHAPTPQTWETSRSSPRRHRPPRRRRRPHRPTRACATWATPPRT